MNSWRNGRPENGKLAVPPAGIDDRDGLRLSFGVTMSAPFNPRLTAAEIILLAADDLSAGGTPEFTEWDLTVASWARDRHRFGLRGYGQKFPDHKRVMMEIMGRKPQNPVVRGLLTK